MSDYVSAFVGDGQERTATIQDDATPPRWTPFEIRYRPMSTDEELAVAAQSSLDPKKSVDEFYKPAVAKKLLGWDLKTNEGVKVDCTPENVGKLTWFPYREIRAIVCGEKAVGPYPTRQDDAKN